MCVFLFDFPFDFPFDKSPSAVGPQVEWGLMTGFPFDEHVEWQLILQQAFHSASTSNGTLLVLATCVPFHVHIGWTFGVTYSISWYGICHESTYMYKRSMFASFLYSPAGPIAIAWHAEWYISNRCGTSALATVYYCLHCKLTAAFTSYVLA